MSDDCPIPQAFWWACGEAALTQNWATGDFTTWIEQTQWRVYGAEFALEDIQGMLPIPKRDIPLNRFSIGNFARAAQCLDEVKSALACEGAQGEAVILKAARAGLVAGRCTRIAWRVSDRYGQQEENEETGVDIPEWFWEHCTSDDTAVLNWRVGRFAGKGCIDGAEYKVTISGVELSVSDIVDI